MCIVDRIFDSYLRSVDATFKAFLVLNVAYLMNAPNFEFFIEMLVSKLMYRFGPDNKTWTNFFQCLRQVPGHACFTVTTKEGPMVDSGKANTTGVNFTMGNVSKLFALVLARINIFSPSDNHLSIAEVLGWTNKAPESMLCASVVEGDLTYAPENLNGIRGLPEVRGSELNGIILHGVPRGERAGREESENTVDLDKTNNRKAQKRVPLGFLGIVTVSSNKRPSDQKSNEEWATIQAVTPSCLPGVHVVEHGGKKQKGLGGSVVNPYSGRSGTPVQVDMIVNMLVIPHLVCEKVALMNHLGVLPAEISAVCKSFSDALMHYTKIIFRGMLHATYDRNASRKEHGYTSRCVVRSMYFRVVQNLPEVRSIDEAVKKLTVLNWASAISPHEVPSIPYMFLSHGIDLGVALLLMVAAKQFEDFPVLLPSELVDFLDDLDKPVSPFVFTYVCLGVADTCCCRYLLRGNS